MADNEGRRLAGTVYIDGTVYQAGDVPSPEHAAKITNPKAWEPADAEPADGPEEESQVGGEDEEPAAGADGDAAAPRPARRKAR